MDKGTHPLASPAQRRIQSSLSRPFKSPVISSPSPSATNSDGATPKRHGLMRKRPQLSVTSKIESTEHTSALNMQNYLKCPDMINDSTCTLTSESKQDIPTNETDDELKGTALPCPSTPGCSTGPSGITNVVTPSGDANVPKIKYAVCHPDHIRTPSGGVKRKHPDSEKVELREKKRILLEQLKEKKEQLRKLQLVKMYQSKVNIEKLYTLICLLRFSVFVIYFTER